MGRNLMYFDYKQQKRVNTKAIPGSFFADLANIFFIKPKLGNGKPVHPSYGVAGSLRRFKNRSVRRAYRSCL
jgi:hypothetical protein